VIEWLGRVGYRDGGGEMDFIDRLEKIVTWKVFIMATILFVIFLVGVLPFIARFSAEKIGVAESPDTMLFYNDEELYDMVEAYGEKGREIYIILRWTFDLIWPLVYMSCLLSGLILFYKDLINIPLKYPIYTVGFLGAVLDYIENIGNTIIMSRFPTRLSYVVKISALATLSKWSLIAIGFFVLAIGMWRYRRGVQKGKS